MAASSLDNSVPASIVDLLIGIRRGEEIARHATNHNAVAQKKRAPTGCGSAEAQLRHDDGRLDTHHRSAWHVSRGSQSEVWRPIGSELPTCLSFRQITLQVRGGRPGMPNRNVDGISKVACTSRHAPASDKLRTEHGSCAFLPRIIVPDLSIRLRGTFRWLAVGFRLDIDRSHS